MCGICGFYGLEDKELLKRMNDVILHRGPDDDGFFNDNNIGLAMRRLSIIDLSTGKQPIFNEDKSMCIVFNGEIYNYKKIREDLKSKNHRFYTNTDTETIIHCYEEYGKKCLERLDGMFAFAIWDSKKKQLFIARDRFGKKPLYYFQKNGIFMFSSELKSLILSDIVKKEVDYQGLHDFLSFRYIPEPNTLIKGIKKLPAAHYMVVNKDGATIKNYWDLSFEFDSKEYSEAYCVEKFSLLLEEAVKKRLMSDVPLGMYLSGGIDSSSVLSLMAKHTKEPVKTFTIGYKIEEFPDETEPAKKVADFYKTEHHEFIVDDNPLDVLPHVVWSMDEPVADPTALPIYLLSKLTKKHVTVVLGGEGSDETLAGYEHYKIMKLASSYLPYIPHFMRKNVIPKTFRIVPDKLLDKFFKYTSSLGEEGKKRFFDLLVNYKDLAKSYMILNSIFTEKEKAEFCEKPQNLKESIRLVKPYFSADIEDSNQMLSEMLMCDIKTFLKHLLLKTDKTTMANSIEARVPFLDTRLVEFTAKIPSHLKLNGKVDKYVLRKAMSNKIPEFITKKKKQRFFVPVHIWYERIFKDKFIDLFSDSTFRSRNYFKKGYVDKIVSNFNNSKLYYGRQIWSLLNLELWMRIYMDQDDISKPKLRMNDLIR